LNCELIEIDFGLNKKVLCKSCEREKIKKLTNQCGNEEMAKLLCDSKLNRKKYVSSYIQWIPFNGFRNIEYLAKCDFGEIHQATWFDYYYGYCHKEDVVLKRIYNSGNKIADISKEVKV